MNRLSRQQQIARDKIIKSQLKSKPAHSKPKPEQTRRTTRPSVRVFFPAIQPTSSIVNYSRPREARPANSAEREATQQFLNDSAEFQRTRHLTFEERLREADVALRTLNKK